MLTDTASSKVTAAHLARTALLYVRQSSLKQVLHNTESAIRQYDLRGKAIALGWPAGQITVIDIDQGHPAPAPPTGKDSSSGRRGLPRPGRDRARPGMLPAGPQLRRLAPAPRALRHDRHADLRRRRPLRPPHLQRPAPAGHERPDVRSRTPFHQGTAARRDLVQGPPRRAHHPAAGRAGLRRRRPRHPRPRHRRPRCRRAPVRHLHRDRVSDRVRQGVQHRGPQFPLAAPHGPPQRRDRLEAAGPSRRAAHPA